MKQYTFQELEAMSIDELKLVKIDALDEVHDRMQARHSLIGQILFYQDLAKKYPPTKEEA